MRPAPALARCPAGYLLQQVLEEGQPVETVRAADCATGAPVMIKMIDAALIPAAARTSIERESAQAQRPEYPGVASVIDTGYVDDRMYIVVPWAGKLTLRQRLASGPLSVADAVAVARGTLAALSHMHGRGALHRDVSPGCLLVDNAGGHLRVTVADFGFSAAQAIARATSATPATGLRYMAPEQAGLLDRPVDGRADLYSLGITLFECLAGSPPFDGPDVRAVLRHQLSTPLPSLRVLGVPVPQALEEILRRLTRKDPDDRYRCAEAALADVISLDLALGQGAAEPDIAVGSRDSRQTLTESALTGREAELAVLHRAVTDAGAGTSRVVVLEADSGGGKSRVLDEFCDRASCGGAWVLRGQGVELAAQYPLQVLGGVISAIAARPEQVRKLAAQLGDAAQALRAVLPELADVLAGPASAPLVPEAQAQPRVVTALAGLLSALGSAEHPCVVALDDCQWADDLTLQVLRAFTQRSPAGDARAGHVLLVVAARPGEGVADQLAGVLFDAERLQLHPMNPRQVRQVVRSMAGPVPDEAVRVIIELARGNPFMVTAVLRGLVESGALAPDGPAWRFTPVPGGWQASREAAAILAQRLALLAPATRRILSAGAVLGRSFDPQLAAQLAGPLASSRQADGAETDLPAAVRQAVDRHLIWWDGAGMCRFAHDRLRMSLLADIEGADLARLHLKAAEHIEVAEPSRSFDLAYHFDAAGKPERALPHAMASALAARARHDLELAERQYRIAERGAASGPGRTRADVAESLGQVLTLRGRYQEAAARFELALRLAEHPISVARLEGELGEALFRTDDLEASVRHGEAALRGLGERIPAATAAVVASLLWEILRRLTARALPRPRAPRTTADHERELAKSRIYTQLQYPRWFHHRRIAVMWLMLRQVNVAERCPGNPELSHSYGVWGGAVTVTFPFLSRMGLRYLSRCLELSRAERDPRGEGHAANMRACALLSTARYAEGAQAGQQAARLLGQFGDPWEVNFAARNRAVCLYRLGRLQEAAEEARAIYRMGVDFGDTNAEVTALEVIAKATGGQVPAGQTRRALQFRGSDLEVTTGAAQAEALRLRHAGRHEEAAARLEDAARQVRRTWPPSTYLVPVYSWLATVHRELAEAALLPAARRRALRRAQRSARVAVRHCLVYPCERPHALREAALVCALRGHPRLARWLAGRSAIAAARQHATAELAETRDQCIRLGMPVPAAADGAEDDARDAGTRAVTPEPSSLGLADRFASLLEAGALLASASSPQAITSAIRQTSVNLLRADRCLVVGIGAGDCDGDLPAGSAMCRTVAEQASRARGPVVVTEPFTDEHDIDDGLVLAGVRSLLCMPVIAQGEVAGCFLATHSHVGQLFGEEEQQLAEFIARLAGAALERMRLHHDTRARIIAAQEAERARVARDLHDEIGQALSSMLLQVRLVEDWAARTALHHAGREPGQSRAVPAEISELRELIIAGLRTTQELAFDLRPAVLDDLGLSAALRRLASNTANGHLVAPKLEIVGLADGDRLPADVETAAYRVVQESLTNVVRHARASECSIVIARQGDRLRVIVEDDGIGFGSADRRAEGLGLRGMSERAELAGGMLSVSSSPGEGTSIIFEVALG